MHPSLFILSQLNTLRTRNEELAHRNESLTRRVKEKEAELAALSSLQVTSLQKRKSETEESLRTSPPSERSSNTAGSGNGPCVMAWGGAHEVYQNNTCVTRGNAGPGVDPYPWGAEGKGCDYSNATMKPVLLHLAANRYLSPNGRYGGACGKDLPELAKLDVEVGSSVGGEPSVAQMMASARRILK